MNKPFHWLVVAALGCAAGPRALADEVRYFFNRSTETFTLLGVMPSSDEVRAGEIEYYRPDNTLLWSTAEGANKRPLTFPAGSCLKVRFLPVKGKFNRPVAFKNDKTGRELVVDCAIANGTLALTLRNPKPEQATAVKLNQFPLGGDLTLVKGF